MITRATLVSIAQVVPRVAWGQPGSLQARRTIDGQTGSGANARPACSRSNGQGISTSPPALALECLGSKLELGDSKPGGEAWSGRQHSGETMNAEIERIFDRLPEGFWGSVEITYSNGRPKLAKIVRTLPITTHASPSHGEPAHDDHILPLSRQ